jgi:outer membrane protein assembly factor BamB
LFTKPSTRGDEETKLFARDVVGRVRWSVPWPAPGKSVSERARIASAARLVGLVAESRDQGRSVLVFDDNDGRLLFEQSLGIRDRVADLAETCWLIVNDKAVKCIDARTGTVTWNVPVFGAKVDAWPLTGGEALVADGNPLALSRIAKDGKRRWQAELPDTDLERPEELDQTGSLSYVTKIGHESWTFSDAMGIASGIVSSKSGVLVLDLETGKTASVH